jgi:uncharacterized membrane protein
MEPAQKIWFDATLIPHRSLGRRGFFLLMVFISLVSFIAGFAFYLMGAWPVFGFFGLDVLAIYLAFKLNYRAAEVLETIRLTDDDLTIRRLKRKGAELEWHFQPYWVRVLIEPLNEFEGEMVLTSHGRRLTVGSFLTLEEKAEVTAALSQALARQRAAVTSAE